MWLYFAAAVMLLGAEAAATRLEAREGEVREGEARDGEAQASREERAPRAAPINAPANAHMQGAPVATHAIAPAPAVQDTRSVGPIGSPVITKVFAAVKANPSRFALAAAGASLFMFTKRDPTKRRS